MENYNKEKLPINFATKYYWHCKQQTFPNTAKMLWSRFSKTYIFFTKYKVICILGKSIIETPINNLQKLLRT